MQSRFSVAAALFLVGCSGAQPVKPTDPADLMTTLTDLQQLGNKHVGSDEGRQAAEYLMQRFQALGLQNVHLEPFSFPRHVVDSQSMSVTVAGQPTPMQFDVFEGSGAGHADADLVYVGTAHPDELANVDLTGKVALLDRDPNYHRSAQFVGVAQKGAVAMLYVSTSPMNLIEVGSVRYDGWTALGPIPSITVGNDDGVKLEQALKAGQTVHAVIDVQAHAEGSQGNSVVATLPGQDASGELVVGAHYDSWFAGSCDNGGGVAAVLGIATRRANEGKPQYPITFVAYDGEEVGLYGGYQFLRQHHIVNQDPILAVLNFEMPSALGATLAGIGRSNHMPLDDALEQSGAGQLYPLYVPMEVVPMILGGLIPTDIQGIYRNGIPTASTATQTPWYHTNADTPDKVDTSQLAQVVDTFDGALDLLLKDSPQSWGGLDDKLWTGTVTPAARAPGQPLVVDVQITDAQARPQANAVVQATLMVDDFFPTSQQNTMTDANGHVQLTFPASTVEQGQGHRFLHVTAGPSYPFAELIVALP